MPKPYQRPHPPLFQAFSISDETIVWCAKQGIIPMTLVTHPHAMARVAKLFQDESAKTGRKLALGQRIGVLRQIYFGQNKEEDLSGSPRWAPPEIAFSRFWGHFGFFEAFRLPGDEEKWPRGKALVPQSEWTVDRMERAHYLFMGSESDIRRKMDELVEAANPEYFLLELRPGDDADGRDEGTAADLRREDHAALSVKRGRDCALVGRRIVLIRRPLFFRWRGGGPLSYDSRRTRNRIQCGGPDESQRRSGSNYRRWFGTGRSDRA